MSKKKPNFNLHILDNGFIFNNIKYNNSDIKSIRLARGRFDLHSVGFGTDSSYNAMLILDMSNDEEVKLIESASSGRKEVVNKIIDFYIQISKSTFTQRSKSYQEQLKNKGCFYYNGWKFHPEEMYFQGANAKYYLDEYSVFKGNGVLWLRPKHPSILEKLKKIVSSKEIGISTTRDPDVLFPLLKSHFSLYWKS